MAKTSHTKRLWFGAGAAAVGRIALNGPYFGYICPLCKQLFPPEKLDQLTWEHAPPQGLKAMKAKEVALTCWSCNNASSRQFDEQMVALEQALEMESGQKTDPVSVRLKVDGIEINALYGGKDGDAMEFALNRDHNDPQRLDELFAKLRAGETYRLQIEQTRRVDPRRGIIGWLRAAYIAAFAALGYNYVLHQDLEPIRQLIKNPDDGDLPVFHSYDASADPEAREVVVMRHKRSSLRGVSVIMGRHAVVLPYSDGFNVEFGALLEKGMVREDFELAPLGWPTRPLHRLDHSSSPRLSLSVPRPDGSFEPPGRSLRPRRRSRRDPHIELVSGFVGADVRFEGDHMIAIDPCRIIIPLATKEERARLRAAGEKLELPRFVGIANLISDRPGPFDYTFASVLFDPQGNECWGLSETDGIWPEGERLLGVRINDGAKIPIFETGGLYKLRFSVDGYYVGELSIPIFWEEEAVQLMRPEAKEADLVGTSTGTGVRVMNVVAATSYAGEGPNITATLLPPLHVTREALASIQTSSPVGKIGLRLPPFYSIITLYGGQPNEPFALRTTFSYEDDSEPALTKRDEYKWPSPSVSSYWRIVLFHPDTTIFIRDADHRPTCTLTVTVEDGNSVTARLPVLEKPSQASNTVSGQPAGTTT